MISIINEKIDQEPNDIVATSVILMRNSNSIIFSMKKIAIDLQVHVIMTIIFYSEKCNGKGN